MKKVEQYIEKKTEWQDELKSLRIVMLKSGMEETVKWGIPTYTVNGKNVAGLAAFKNHVAVWFFNGVFLKDKEKVLINAQEDKTKGLRQWRFESPDQIKPQLILEYALEAKENQLQGKEIKPEKRSVTMPDELRLALQEKKLVKNFDKLTAGKKREYAEYINSAKRKETKESRIEKILPLIKDEKGLNDKYRK